MRSDLPVKGNADSKHTWNLTAALVHAPDQSRLPERLGVGVLLRCPDPRHEPHPLSLIGHRDQLLPVPAPFDIPSHAEERPADLAERLVAIPADRNLTAAPRPRTWSRLRTLANLVHPDWW